MSTSLSLSFYLSLLLSLYLAHSSPCWPGLPLHIFAIQRKAYLTLPLALLRQACGMLAFPLFTPPSTAPSAWLASAAGITLIRARRGSSSGVRGGVPLLMLVNCKYLINLHGYFYAGKSSLLVGVRKRLSVPVPVPVSVSVHIRVGDDVDEPGMQSSLTHTLRLNMWASLSCLPAWSHAVFSVLFSLLCCPHLPVSLSPCPCPLLWLPCIICKQI